MACIYLVLETGGCVITTSKERQAIKKSLAEAPELPQNFLDVYEKVYPGSMSNTIWGYAFKERFSTVDFKYPVRDAAVTLAILRAKGTFWNTTFMAFMIENYATPQQCLQFNLSRFDFTRNCIGAEAASHYYFKKPLADLTDDEVLEILVMYQNPSLYNKQSSNPRKVAEFYKSFNRLKARYNSNLSVN
ncbi:transglycosylase domain-containing protein [Flavobacterium akiainvivens]|nr:transglycosylase domain-containing protein [Flavobacterium akiainvivens]